MRFRGRKWDDINSIQLDLKQKIWHYYVLRSKCKEKAATDEVQNVQHAASMAKSLPGKDKCRTAELHKAQFWSSAAKERRSVQQPLLCDGIEHKESNRLCNSALGAMHSRAALWVFFLFCFNNPNQIGYILMDIFRFVFSSPVFDDAPYHAQGDYFVYTSVAAKAEYGVNTAQRGRAVVPASRPDHFLHSNGSTKSHSCPTYFTHFPTEAKIKSTSQVLSLLSFKFLRLSMIPSLLETAGCYVDIAIAFQRENISLFKNLLKNNNKKDYHENLKNSLGCSLRVKLSCAKVTVPLLTEEGNFSLGC